MLIYSYAHRRSFLYYMRVKGKIMSNIERKKVTIKDVAKAAGVVPSTVSHVLHGTASISDETKARVLKVIDELGYLPNATARALRSNKSGLIGVVVPDISCEFYAQCAAFIMKEAQKDGYTVLLSDAFFGDGQNGIKALVERCVDGFIFVGGNHDEDIIKYVTSKNIPIVLGDREYENFPNVNFDNEKIINKMVQAFYEIGYRRFAYLGEPKEVQSNLTSRYRGYEKGIGHFKDITSKVVFERMCMRYRGHSSAGYEIFKHRFIDEHFIPEVIFTTTDMLAHGVISSALENGIKIPEQMAVVGFNDMMVSEYFTPPLTTVRQDTSLLGRNCYKLLRKILVDKTTPSNIIIDQQAVIRKSAVIPFEILEKYELL